MYQYHHKPRDGTLMFAPSALIPTTEDQRVYKTPCFASLPLTIMRLSKQSKN